MEETLDLGWGQFYMGLAYHLVDAYGETNINTNEITCCPPYAIFSKRYYNEINKLNHEKIYDYCFIGSINSNYEARKWVIEFAKKYFTTKSIFVNTDEEESWVSLGEFDFTNNFSCYNPKKQEDNQSAKVQYRVVNENKEYFETMCKSKFVLCPAGDSSWSFRFYEVLMCKSLPIVFSWHHTYRTKEESQIGYKFILYDNLNMEYSYEDYLKENIFLFEKYHLLNEHNIIKN